MKALKSSRLHIGIFGKTNVGKSSFLNAVAQQEISIVSDTKGTTTDVVEKSMELFPIGPVTFLDTAGINDETTISNLRIEKTLKIIDRTDIALIICDYNGIDEYETDLIEKFNELEIPFVVIINKTDEGEITDVNLDNIYTYCPNVLSVSAKNDKNITDKLAGTLLNILPDEFITPPSILGDLVDAGDFVILVTPIDKEAPKGRLILPQVQTIRDIIDNKCISVVTNVENLKNTLSNLNKTPKLVVTDSQAFRQVSEIVPKEIPLTSFSILFARLKGNLETFVKNAKHINDLKPEDKILILESCTHHQIEDDIARVKIPLLLEKKLGFKPDIDFFTGHDFPDITPYKFIIHCGACMTNRREILSRIMKSEKLSIPISNYGIVISYCLGILDRAVEIFDLNQK